MDSRAFRLGLNDTTFFEVDKPTLFEVKEPLVADIELQCRARHLIQGMVGQFDLGEKLLAAGFDPTRPTCWLMEGLLPYLTVPVMRQLANDIGGRLPSRLARTVPAHVTFMSARPMKVTRKVMSISLVGGPP